ncbi:LLM class flavin-dependent oxidoreductase [Azohydromonas lata]|uniref:LLM class flavin-dependent oxidoreductase n=1 Tax=Azohydromonas lata TaxID=45677 RepID=A0ABU5IB08_9BURK|nr:LLM class flavin-dependent oxidoreductase [Azohydromonas lata]MDZ5455850.1 LLM class flavin-dependent oxidoreductase [Azohydromonas lata]
MPRCGCATCPSFGDLGQIHDPWVYLGWIAAHTQTIALATGSIVLPLRHPLHVAKAAASVDQLSAGRLVLGVASGDRPVEFPAFGVDIERRTLLFRDYFEVIHRVLELEYSMLESTAGVLTGNADLVPKPLGRLLMLVTGNSGQPLPGIAGHADGWITYPRGIERQAEAVARWRGEVQAASPGVFKPFVQSLYVDLTDNAHLPPTPIHLGFRAGRHFLLRFLDAPCAVGVNHVILNFKYGARPASEVFEVLLEGLAVAATVDAIDLACGLDGLGLVMDDEAGDTVLQQLGYRSAAVGTHPPRLARPTTSSPPWKAAPLQRQDGQLKLAAAMGSDVVATEAWRRLSHTAVKSAPASSACEAWA